MTLFDLLSIFPFGETTPCKIQDSRHTDICSCVVERPSAYKPITDTLIPVEAVPFLSCDVVEFYAEEDTVFIVLDMKYAEHLQYLKYVQIGGV